MDQVAQRFANESVSRVIGSQPVAAKNRQTTQRVEESGRLFIEDLRARADGEHPHVAAGLGNVAAGKLRELRMTIQDRLLQQRMAQRNRIPRDEPLPPIVARQAELAVAGDGLETGCRPVETESRGRRIETARSTGSLGRRHQAVAAAVGSIDPIVGAPDQSIHAELLVAFSKTGEQRFAPIGPAVAVGIL